MSTRAYGQYCGFARAIEVVGERWALLIVRDLLVGPKRFTDLLRGLPGIPSNVLSARLKELEDAEVVQRRVAARPARGVMYELTPYGADLEDVVVRLGRWGARRLGDPRAEETITVDSLSMALRSTFQPDEARGVRATYELRGGPLALHARVEDGTIAVTPGSADAPDLVLEAGPGVRALMARDVTPQEALDAGLVRIIDGDPERFTEFARLFKIDPR